MKRLLVFLLIILIFLPVSCAQSVDDIQTQTATAATAVAAAWTKTSFPTLTHTPSFTPTITSTSTMTPTITPTPLGGGSGQIAFLSGGDAGISLINSDGTGMLFFAESPIRHPSSHYAWSPNGGRFAYPGDGGVCVVDTYDSNVKCFGMTGPLAWSPDESELAIAGTGITVVGIESGDKRTLVEGEYYGNTQAPNWSPDGRKLVYSKKGDVYTINADGTDETMLVKNASNPIWSPDGTQIAYVNYQGNIIVMNSDGTNKVTLTPSQSFGGDMMWTSDGNFIVYLIYVGGPYNGLYDLHAVEVKGSKLMSFTKTHNVLSYTLSPDGSAIAYTIGSYKALEKGECFKSFITSIKEGTVTEWKGYPCTSIVGSWRPESNSDESATLSIPSISCASNNDSDGPSQSSGSDAVSTPLAEQAWEFGTDGDLEGWTNRQNLAPLQLCDGYLLSTSIGNNALMYSPKIRIDAKAFSKIEVRMKTDSYGGISLLFASTTDPTKFGGISINNIGDKQFHTYIVDMSVMDAWKGVVSQIGLYLNKPQTTVVIDYIRVK